MIKATDFKNGTIFEDGKNVFQVLWFQHHKPGKGGALVRTKIKNLNTGSTVEKSFKCDEKYRQPEVLRRKKTFMYAEGDIGHFMDMETYDQVEVPLETVGSAAKYLVENMEVETVSLDGKLMAIDLPPSVYLKVAETVPGVRGDSVSNLYKPAKMANGLELTVPLFINEGDEVRVDTRTGKYLERKK